LRSPIRRPPAPADVRRTPGCSAGAAVKSRAFRVIARLARLGLRPASS